MSEDLSADQVRQKSREILGQDIDYSYITEELVRADAALGDDAEAKATDKSVLTTWWGNNARYGTRVINGSTYSVYYFDHGGRATDPNYACGSSTTGWVRMDMWHHSYHGNCPNGREKWSFSQ